MFMGNFERDNHGDAAEVVYERWQWRTSEQYLPLDDLRVVELG